MKSPQPDEPRGVRYLLVFLSLIIVLCGCAPQSVRRPSSTPTPIRPVPRTMQAGTNYLTFELPSTFHDGWGGGNTPLPLYFSDGKTAIRVADLGESWRTGAVRQLQLGLDQLQLGQPQLALKALTQMPFSSADPDQDQLGNLYKQLAAARQALAHHQSVPNRPALQQALAYLRRTDPGDDLHRRVQAVADQRILTMHIDSWDDFLLAGQPATLIQASRQKEVHLRMFALVQGRLLNWDLEGATDPAPLKQLAATVRLNAAHPPPRQPLAAQPDPTQTPPSPTDWRFWLLGGFLALSALPAGLASFMACATAQSLQENFHAAAARAAFWGGFCGSFLGSLGLVLYYGQAISANAQAQFLAYVLMAVLIGSALLKSAVAATVTGLLGWLGGYFGSRLGPTGAGLGASLLIALGLAALASQGWLSF